MFRTWLRDLPRLQQQNVESARTLLQPRIGPNHSITSSARSSSNGEIVDHFGTYVNCWPPTDASAIAPAIDLTMTATPSTKRAVAADLCEAHPATCPGVTAKAATIAYDDKNWDKVKAVFAQSVYDEKGTGLPLLPSSPVDCRAIGRHRLRAPQACRERGVRGACYYGRRPRGCLPIQTTQGLSADSSRLIFVG